MQTIDDGTGGRVTDAIERLEKCMERICSDVAELSKNFATSDARHGKWLESIDKRLDTLNGSVAKHTAELAECATRNSVLNLGDALHVRIDENEREISKVAGKVTNNESSQNAAARTNERYQRLLQPIVMALLGALATLILANSTLFTHK
jgi:hypothetical protein